MSDVKIKVLEGLDHVRLRPEMYIGSTYNPSHLVTEILDNALDELANNFANKVTVDIGDTTICITDNGRGIPIHDVYGFEEDSIIISATQLFSGAKFDNEAYDISIGLHGVGLAVTNALSNWLIIEVAKGDSIYRYEFVNSVFSNQTIRPKVSTDPSTLVSFEPNNKYFTTLCFGLEAVRKRLYLIAARVNGSTIVLNGEKIPVVTMTELVKYYLRIEDHQFLTSAVISKGAQTVTMYVTYDTEKITMGDVNLNICTGTYLTTLSTLFAKACVKRYPALTRANVLSGLKIYCSAFIQDPRFEGQVKHKMVKDLTPLLELFVPKMESMIKNEFFATHLQSLVDSKAVSGASKKLKRVKMVGAGNPLKDCKNKPGKTMFIVEGDSAGGTLHRFRDSATEAIFPLSGKILNTIKKNIDEVLTSKKMKYFLEAIGVDPRKKNQTDFRYQDFVIVADADCLAYDVPVQYIKDGQRHSCIISEFPEDLTGIEVLSSDNNKVESKQVTRFIKRPSNGRKMMKVTIAKGISETFTEDHGLYVHNSTTNTVETVAMKDIDIKTHKLIGLNNISNGHKLLTIRNIEYIDYDHDYVYCLEVKDNHNFYCGKHNIKSQNCDGGHIIVLVLLAFWKFAPEIIRAGRLKVLFPPLYGTYINKQFIPIYDDSEVAKYRQQGAAITRFKGLGEMDSSELKVIVRSGEREYQIAPPKNEQTEFAILSCITNTDLKRKLCNDVERYNLQRIFDAM